MQCKKCKKYLDYDIKYCPFCGEEQQENIPVNEFSEEHSVVRKLYKEKKYKQLLEYALDDDSLAKYYYLKYIKKWVKSWTAVTEYKEVFKKIIELSDKGNPFAMTSYGLLLCELYRHKSDIENITRGFAHDEDIYAKGIKLIEKSANEFEEAAALAYLGEWYAKGLEGYSIYELKAFRCMKKSAEELYPTALYYLGMWYYKGENGIKTDVEEGYKLLEKAAYFDEGRALKIIKEVAPKWDAVDAKQMIVAEDIAQAKKYVETFEEKDDGDKLYDPSIDKIYKGIEMESDEELYQYIYEDTELETLIDNCKTPQDLISAYKTIESKELKTYDKQVLLDGILDSIGKSLNMKISSIDEVDMFLNNTELSRNVIHNCNQLSDFLTVKEKLAEMQISEDVIRQTLSYGSKQIEKNYAKELQIYSEYKKQKIEENSGCSFIGGLIFLGIITFFVPVVGWILIGLYIIGSIGSKSDNKKAEKYMSENEGTYKLVEELIKYGYKIGE